MKLHVITVGTHLDSSSSLGLPTPLRKERVREKGRELSGIYLGGLMDGRKEEDLDLKAQCVAFKEIFRHEIES